MDEVVDDLIEDGYAQVSSEENLINLRGKHFTKDNHCEDVILFPSDQKEHLKSLNVVLNGHMVLQVIF